MEVFFGNMASDAKAAERLLRDLSQAEEDAEELFEAEGGKFSGETKERFLSRLEQVKAACRSIQGKAMAGAKAADRTVREHPYSVAGVAFGLGLVVGALVLRRTIGADEED